MDKYVNGNSPKLPEDKNIAYALQELMSALEQTGAIYTLGGESLVGFAEGNITRYKYNIYLYLFQVAYIFS